MAKNAAIIVAVVAIAALAVIWKLRPNSASPPRSDESAAEVCLNNLRLIQSGKMQWSLERHKAFNQSPTWDDLRPFIGRGSNQVMPECPQHGIYTIGTVGEEPSCSIHGTLHDVR